jgi:hypothetical protein
MLPMAIIDVTSRDWRCYPRVWGGVGAGSAMLQVLGSAAANSGRDCYQRCSVFLLAVLLSVAVDYFTTCSGGSYLFCYIGVFRML